MLNPLLLYQLTEMGVDPATAPTPEQWNMLLAKISTIYTDYQSAEIELRQSEMLYEELYNSTWRQAQELSLLVRVREALANKLNANAVIQTVVEATAESFGYALVSVYLIREDVLYLQHQVGYEKLIEQMPLSKGIMGRVARTGKAVLAEDCRVDRDFIPAIDDLISEVCVPIRNNGQIVGVLNVETLSPQKLSSNDLEMMTTLSEHVGLAMERAQLYTAVQESNQKYQMVVDNVREVIFQMDVTGRITFMNKAWFALSGYSVEQSLGKHLSHFVLPEVLGSLPTMQTMLQNNTQQDTRLQSILIKPDGSTVPIEAHVHGIYDQNGTVIGLGGIAIDIRDRLKAEQEARETQLLVQVQKAVSSKLGIKDMIRSIVEVTAETFGYELVSVYLLDGDNLRLQHQVGYENVITEFPITKGVAGRVIRTQKPVLIENAADDPDFLHALEGLSSEICVPLFDNGQAIGTIIVEARDNKKLTQIDLKMLITLGEQLSVAVERARLYTAIEESNQKYEMVVDNVREVIFQLDVAGNFTFVNKSWLELSGYSVDYSLGKHFSHFVLPEVLESLLALQSMLLKNVQQDARIQSMLLKPDGSSVPIEAHIHRVNDQSGTLIGLGGIAVDIRDRMQAEQQARELQLLVSVQEAISPKLGLKDMIHSIVEVIAKTYRYELVCIYLLKGEMLYLQHQVGYENVIEEFPISRGVAGRVVRTQKPILVDDPTSDPDFQYAIEGLTSEACVPLLGSGEVIGFINVETKSSNKLQDVDLQMLVRLSEQVSIAIERAALYTALQESNQKYQMVVDNVREIIFQTDLKGNITFLNQAWERITGHTIADSMDKPFKMFMPLEYIESVERVTLELLQSQSTQPYIQFESELIKADLTRIPIESQLQRIYDVEGQLIGLGGTTADITQRVQAKKQEQQLGLLVQVRAAISSQLGLKDTIRTIVEATAEAFGYDLVGVYLLQGDTLYLQHQVGYEIKYDPVNISVGVSGRVARTGKPALVQDTLSDPDFVHAINSLSSEVCVPLLNNGQVIGIMNVEAKGSTRLTEVDLGLMIELSEHVSIAVERAQLYGAVVESNQKYQMVVDNVQEVIFQLDPEGRFTFLNQSWVDLSGYSLDKSIGKHFSAFMHPDDVDKSEAMGNLLYDGVESDIRYQHTLIRSDNTALPVEIHMQLVFNASDELMGIGGTAINISERLQAEKQSLDLLLQTRTVEMLKGFLTGVSHDLRTPLSIMNTSLYLLRRKLGEAAENNRYLDALESQTVHMQHVVEDMLDMSKLDDESAKLNLIRIDVNGLIRDLLVTLNSKAQQIHFTATEDHPFILGDQFMIGKVITNIVKNAIQYTPDNGSITLRTYHQAPSSLSIEIKDSGIGIDAGTLPHIFDRFYKANKARPSGQGGAGLGLSIARKIVELHGGSITAESIIDTGSTFTITLPAEPPDSPP